MKLNVLKAEQIKNGEIPLEKAYKLYGAENVNSAVAELRKSDAEILAKYSAEDMKAAVFGKSRAQTEFSDMDKNRTQTKCSKRRFFATVDHRSGQIFAQHDNSRRQAACQTEKNRHQRNRLRSSHSYSVVAKIASVAAVLVIALGISLSQFQQKSKIASAQSIDISEASRFTENPTFQATENQSQNSEARAKGNAIGSVKEPRENQLVLYKKTADGTVILKSGDSAAEGDLIQISYNSGGNKYGIIFSVDGNKTVTRHFPENTWNASPLANGLDLLDFSYELDDAPDFEDFIFLASKECFSISEKDAYKVFAEDDYMKKKLGNVSKTEVFVNKR